MKQYIQNRWVKEVRSKHDILPKWLSYLRKLNETIFLWILHFISVSEVSLCKTTAYNLSRSHIQQSQWHFFSELRMGIVEQMYNISRSSISFYIEVCYVKVHLLWDNLLPGAYKILSNCHNLMRKEPVVYWCFLDFWSGNNGHYERNFQIQVMWSVSSQCIIQQNVKSNCVGVEIVAIFACRVNVNYLEIIHFIFGQWSISKVNTYLFYKLLKMLYL